MKINTYIILFITLICNSCKKDAVDSVTSSTGITYSQSLSNWQSYKQSVHNNYTYTATSGSVFGFYSETKITVQNGVVTARDYMLYTQATGSITYTVTKTWSETSANLNKHGQYEGAEVLTIDEVYTKAKSVWLVADKGSNSIYFETDSKGIISTCGFVPKGCQDDCFNGIRIKKMVGL